MIVLVKEINFLFARYVVVELDMLRARGIVWQWPWWSIKTAFTRGKFWCWSTTHTWTQPPIR
jgi:hypothetical protein